MLSPRRVNISLLDNDEAPPLSARSSTGASSFGAFLLGTPREHGEDVRRPRTPRISEISCDTTPVTRSMAVDYAMRRMMGTEDAEVSFKARVSKRTLRNHSRDDIEVIDSIDAWIAGLDGKVQQRQPGGPAPPSSSVDSTPRSSVGKDLSPSTSSTRRSSGLSGRDLVRLLDSSVPDPEEFSPTGGRKNVSLCQRLQEAYHANLLRAMYVMKRYDVDGSGQIDRSEFGRMLKELVGLPASNQAPSPYGGPGFEGEVNALFASLDADSSGNISFTEIHKQMHVVRAFRSNAAGSVASPRTGTPRTGTSRTGTPRTGTPRTGTGTPRTTSD